MKKKIKVKNHVHEELSTYIEKIQIYFIAK